MLTKRIIPCLDVKDNKVVKGIRFREHRIIGDILTLAQRYVAEGADELVFYDITASSDEKIRTVDHTWVRQLAKILDIPFCVAGGIRDKATARDVLAAGADKISINSPALERPDFITELAYEFGSQCVVVGIDSYYDAQKNNYCVYQYTGHPEKMVNTQHSTLDWALQAQALGAGEIVLNCMNQDGVRQGYDTTQLAYIKKNLNIPLIASGGAGSMKHFDEVFKKTNVDGALAASVFHDQIMSIPDLKQYLKNQFISIRL